MASWKKVIVSGSGAELGSVTTTGNIIATGSLAANSTVKFPGLTNASQATIVGIDVATGQLYYQGTGSFTANSASYALSASYAKNADTASSADNFTIRQQAGIGTAPVSNYPLYISSSVNDESLGIDSSAAVNAMYFLKGGDKKFEVSFDTTTDGIFRLLPYSSSTFFEIGNPSNAGTDYVFVSEKTYGNVMIGPGISNGAGSIGGALSTDKVQVKGNLYVSGSTRILDGLAVQGLTSVSASYLVGYDPTTGAMSYTGTGSVVSVTSSFAVSASHAENADNAVTASRATSAADADNATSASYAATGNGTFSGSFSGSFQGNGSGLTDIPASGIVGLQLNQIASGSATASIAPDLGFRVNTDTQITGSLSISSSAANFSILGNGFGQTQLSSNGALVLNPGSGGLGMAGVNQYITAGYIVGQTTGTQLTGSFTGSFAGVASLPPLTQGKGITAFTYDGSLPDSVEISGSLGLSANTVTKWTGDAFANSSITDSTNVTINNAGGVLVQQGGLYVTGSSIFHDSVTVQGNLTVAGTASFQHSDNLAIADQFILLNSGSTTFEDSGIIISTGNSGNSGSAFFLETAGTTTGTDALNGRFAVASGIQPNATTVTAEEYANTTKIVAAAPTTEVPQFGGSGLGQGNMWVDTTTSDIWIYA